MYYPFHPLLKKQIAEFLEESSVNDPRLEALLMAINESYEKASEDQRDLEILKAAYKHLDQFAGVVAHDLRAPLRSIASLAEWIKEDSADQLPPSIENKIQLLIAKSQHLEKLVSGIMSYSRIEKSKKEKDYVNLKCLFDTCIELLSPGNALKVTMEGDLPDIYTYRVQLSQVFMNLISNSIQHAGIDAELRIRCGYGSDGLVFAFLDNGPGIALSDQTKIFEMFGKAENSTTESTGIGLSITKRLIEENGGAINVQSELGKGACFMFDWPCEILTIAKTSS